MPDILFQGWGGPLRVLVVVTVALGSALATTMLSKDVCLVEGVLALALLIGLQFIVTWAGVRSEWVQSLIKARPRLLFHRGRFLPDAMRRERVTREEIMAALRQNGVGALDTATVVLETDGSLSVLDQPGTQASLEPVVGMPGEGASSGREARQRRPA